MRSDSDDTPDYPPTQDLSELRAEQARLWGWHDTRRRTNPKYTASQSASGSQTDIFDDRVQLDLFD